MDNILPVFTLLFGVALGAIVAKFFISQNKISKSAFDKLSSDKTIVETKLENYQSENEGLKTRNDGLELELRTFREKSVSLETEKNSLIERFSQHKDDLAKMEEKFKIQFENLANKIFDEKNAKFKLQSQESLGELLNPLREKIVEFQKKVDDSFGGHAKEQFALKEEIKRIIEVNEKMTFQTESLSNALKGDVKVQGDWGEVILERILEESGLKKDRDYVLQGINLGIKNPEGGRHQMPDVIINLPEGKHIIVDAKVSLTHYERLAEETDEDIRAGYLKQFSASVRSHVVGLDQRRYQDTEKLGTPDFVLMFMPIEGAYFLAIQQDHELQSFAWNKRVVIVCPSTLFATLRTIHSVWRLELQNCNAIEIAKAGGALYDKIAGFVGDMQKLGDQLKATDKTYSEALAKLSEGKGNILRRTEQLKELGAKASKSLPKDLISFNDDGDESTSQIKEAVDT